MTFLSILKILIILVHYFKLYVFILKIRIIYEQCFILIYNTYRDITNIIEYAT